MSKNRLELTWIGKDSRPRLEPRILLEDESLSYHAKTRRPNDHFDNVLIHGDNLLALKALEAEYTGKIKCVYIDPPYNTGQMFENYEDGIEHSIWLSLMRERLSLLKNLLTEDGLIFVQIDDNEMAYLTVLMDEIFLRQNRLNVIAVKMSEVSGVKMSHVDKRLPKLKEYILVYKKNVTPKLDVELIPAVNWNEEYKTIFTNISKDQIDQLKDIIATEIPSDDLIDKCNLILKNVSATSLSSYFLQNRIAKEEQNQFKFDNAWRIVQAVGSSSVLKLALTQPVREQDVSAVKSSTGIIYLYKTDFDRNSKQPRVQIIFADDNLMKNPGDFWQDIKTTGGVAQEGGVLFPNGKKPEMLLKRIIGMCTRPGDWVLDSFAGSGTTAAVAHKMGRRWISIELKDHCLTHIVPRLQSVIDGRDESGITDNAGWRGGGGYRFYRLAPSMLEKDTFGNWVISKAYNAAMLSEAVCKHMGFTYDPSSNHYWMHGYSSESDFIYVTTNSLTYDQLRVISDEVGPERTLKICCKAFQSKNQRDFSNLSLVKIPAIILDRCEWGKDDYSLKISSLPMAEEIDYHEPEPVAVKQRKKKGATKVDDQATLFGSEEP